jgi:hypothetical protein
MNSEINWDETKLFSCAEMIEAFYKGAEALELFNSVDEACKCISRGLCEVLEAEREKQKEG